MSIKPTVEQQDALDAFSTGDDVVIEAGAGCGKTSTLKMLGRSTADRGVYIAYNKAIADDASASFPSNVQCRTAHSLAFRAVGHKFKDRLGGGFQPLWKTAKHLGITTAAEFGERVLSYTTLARLALEMVDNFCNSADPEITTRHRPFVEGLATAEKDWHRELGEELLPFARRAWDDLTNPKAVDSPIKFKHDCQPTGTLVRRAVSRGGHFGASFEDVPIETLREGDYVMSWTPGENRLGSVRRQGRRVTAVGQRHYDGDLVRVTTVRGRTSAYTAEHRCVVRLDTDLADGNHVVYLARRGDDYRVGRTTWRTRTQGNTLGIRRRAESQGADAVWVLSVHATDAEAALAEALASHEFRVPTWQFVSLNETMPLAAFWMKVGGNRAAAAACLAAHGRDLRYPLWERGAWYSTRRPIIMRACNLLNGMLVCEPDEVQPSPSAKGHLACHDGSGAWAAVTVTREAYDGMVYNLDVDVDHTYVADGIVTHNCYLKIWQLGDPVIDTDYILFDECQDANPVIASIVFRQNCQRVMVGDRAQAIYGWRGAVDAMTTFDAPHRLTLSQSFRFGAAIAEQANAWLESLGTPLRLRGFDQIDSVVTNDLETPRALLCRSNAGALDALLGYQAREVKAHLVGGAQDIGRFCKAVMELQTSGRTSHRDLIAFASWDEVVQYVKDDKKGAGDLATWVGIIDRYGVEKVSSALAQQHPHEDTAEVTISTAHKAKGREWSSVKIHHDFAPKTDKETGEVRPWSGADVMLNYVAVTRAMNTLDPGPLGSSGEETSSAAYLAPDEGDE